MPGGPCLADTPLNVLDGRCRPDRRGYGSAHDHCSYGVNGLPSRRTYAWSECVDRPTDQVLKPASDYNGDPQQVSEAVGMTAPLLDCGNPPHGPTDPGREIGLRDPRHPAMRRNV
jgi:hypothetical protein